MFLPPWHEAKHADPESRTATDCRQGYGLALGWSFLTGMVIAGDSDPTAIISLWAISAIVIIFIYESYIRSTRSVGGGEVDET